MSRLMKQLQLFLQGSDASYGAIPYSFQSGELQFLVIQHNKGHWGFPKGHPEGTEQPLETATRELTEETGLTQFELLPTPMFTEKYEFKIWGKKIPKSVGFFLAEVKDTTTSLQVDEIQAAKWLTVSEAGQVLSFPQGKKILQLAAEYLEGQDN
jgi:bis(5'-nucleosidyl)-tetraphosphatase